MSSRVETLQPMASGFWFKCLFIMAEESPGSIEQVKMQNHQLNTCTILKNMRLAFSFLAT